MTKFADLHIHTHYSDSTLSPQEVVEEAHRLKIACIAITDHDTIDGIGPTQIAAKSFDIEVIPAIELSSEIQGKDVHILGYFIDCSHSLLKEELTKMQAARVERIKKMIQKLKAQGIDNIDFAQDFGDTRSYSLGRPHLAMVLKQKGWVSSISEAFEKYLGEGCPAYVGKWKISPYEAIALIRKSAGLAVLAHPMVTNRDELIPGFVEAGLRGIEVYYPNYSKTTIDYYKGIAKKHKLITTGGSDAHGKAKSNTTIGKVRIPYTTVETMKEELQKS